VASGTVVGEGAGVRRGKAAPGELGSRLRAAAEWEGGRGFMRSGMRRAGLGASADAGWGKLKRTQPAGSARRADLLYDGRRRERDLARLLDRFDPAGLPFLGRCRT
jgi:hypothetical protein